MAMPQKPLVKLDIRAFKKSAKKHIGKDWPKHVVKAVARLAELGALAVKVRTRTKFKLHSEFILRGIRHSPSTEPQQAAARRALVKYHDFTAAVYLAGNKDPTKSLRFMADHELGERRNPQDEYIALPSRALKSKSFQTGKGRVRKRWLPETLLKRYHEAGSRFTGRTTTNKGKKLGPRKRRLPGKPFIIRTRRGDPAIARRTRKAKGSFTKTLEFLYIMKRKADIKDAWGFKREVYRTIKNSYQGVFARYLNNLPNYTLRR